MTYQEFLESKIRRADYFGFDVPADALHTSLFPHQRDVCRWAIKGGRRAIFMSFGLGKTRVQCEIQRQINASAGGKHLIICPLGVKQEFQHVDGPALGMEIVYIRTHSEAQECQSPFMITNYERVRDGDIDVNQFLSVSLDEASVLRSFGSKTYQTFLTLFEKVPYRFVATATPSPNKYKELIHYAGFLGIMDTGQALTRFFKRDSTKANNLTLYPHKQREFWLWLASWACFVEKPSDFGYPDDGYNLPKLNIFYHTVPSDHNSAPTETDGQARLFRDAAISLRDASREKRDTIKPRLNKSLEIIASEPADTHWIIWHHLEDERRAIERALPEAKTVYGSQNLEDRENLIIDFSEGRFRILATKPEIAGSGCNFQRHCHAEIFMGIDYKFNDIIQSIHRVYRFLQSEDVTIHFIIADSEQHITEVIKEKWRRHEELVLEMRGIVQKYGLNSTLTGDLMRSIGIERQEVSGRNFIAVNNDCVAECSQMVENSIDLIHTSIPFSNHYEYCASFNDFGHNDDNEKFFEQMDFLIPQLHRVLRPGRVAAIHVKDRILYGNVTGHGMPSVDPFSDLTRERFQRHGFIYCGRITVVTDVVRENNQTYRLGWTENSKDSTKMGVGCPEYVLLFRKLPSDTSRAYADVPVLKDKPCYTRSRWQIDAHAYWRSNGNRLLKAEDFDNWSMSQIQHFWKNFNESHVYDYTHHVALGEHLERQGKLPAVFMLFAPVSHVDGVWTDVNRMLTLNGNQSKHNLSMHVCPLQFDIVNRIIERYSNPGELVLDPFGGLMTVPYCAVNLGRKGYGIELHTDYWRDGVMYLRAAEAQLNHPTLFDAIDVHTGDFINAGVAQ